VAENSRLGLSSGTFYFFYFFFLCFGSAPSTIGGNMKYKQAGIKNCPLLVGKKKRKEKKRERTSVGKGVRKGRGDGKRRSLIFKMICHPSPNRVRLGTPAPSTHNSIEHQFGS
jgi:hypothetical protein